MTDNSEIRGPVRCIYEIVDRLDISRFDVILIAGAWQKDIYRELEARIRILYFDVKRGKWNRAAFFFFSVPSILKEYAIDVYHVPDTKPLPIFARRTKIVSTIHDTAEYVVPLRFGRFSSIYRKIVERMQCIRSDRIITVSHSSKSDLVKYLGVPPSRIEVIHNGTTALGPAAENSNEIEIARKDTLSILFVGVLETGKNVERLVAAFGNLPAKVRDKSHLYLVGRKANAYPEICKAIASFHVQSQVDVLGYVDDQTLASLYRTASIFAYVSEYEGFGLPVLEAMHRGLPVLTSNRSSLPEIAGSAALLVETDVASISKGLERLIEDETLRIDLSRRGRIRAAEFDWAKTARKTEQVYLQVLGLAEAGNLDGADQAG